MESSDYIVNLDTGCWEWQRLKNADGYGQFMKGRKVTLAHRHFYERHAAPIPKGMVIDHLCRNRGCVNPEHMEVVTRAINNQRGANAKLTAADVSEIRRLWATGKHKQVELSKKFGIHPKHVSSIIRNLKWKEASPLGS